MAHRRIFEAVTLFPARSPRLAAAATFLSFGTVFGLWGGSVPTVAAHAGVDAATLGFAFTLFTVGYIVGLVASGPVAGGVAIRRVLLLVVPAQGLMMVSLLFAASPLAFVVGLLALGSCGGLLDGAMNTEGTAVEADMKRPVLASFHGAASLGFGLSSVLGSFLTVKLGLLATALVAVGVVALAMAVIASATPDRGIAPLRGGAAPKRFGTAILLIGMIVGITAAAETISAMFSSPYLTSLAPHLAAYAGAGGTAFALAQAFVRFGADRLRARFGDPALLIGSVLLGAGGFAVIAMGPNFWIAAIGFGIVGIGTACIAPCCFSLAATRTGMSAASAIAAMGLVSAIPRIPSPWAFGEIAALASYAYAFAAIVGLMLVAALLAAVFARQPQPERQMAR